MQTLLRPQKRSRVFIDETASRRGFAAQRYGHQQEQQMAENDKPTTRPGVSGVQRAFGAIANTVARESGRPWVFSIALLIIIIWAATGPLFSYSDTWQLIINTGTTIVTFLMVFLIQNSQNRDNAAIQVKLDELIRVGAGKNFFVGVEHLTDAEIERLRKMIEDRVSKGSSKSANLAVQAVAEAAGNAAEQAGS